MRPGVKPQPTALRVLRGNPGKRPLNTHEPVLPVSESLDLPPELLDDAAAAKEWTRLAPMLRDAGIVTDGEWAALVALCQQWSRYLEATSRIKLAGMVIKSPSGYPMPNPYIGIANHALSHCTKLWAELGLTPSSRSRVVAVGKKQDINPLAKFRQVK